MCLMVHLGSLASGRLGSRNSLYRGIRRQARIAREHRRVQFREDRDSSTATNLDLLGILIWPCHKTPHNQRPCYREATTPLFYPKEDESCDTACWRLSWVLSRSGGSPWPSTPHT